MADTTEKQHNFNCLPKQVSLKDFNRHIRPFLSKRQKGLFKMFDIALKILYIKYTCEAGVPSRHIPVPSPVYTYGTVESKKQGNKYHNFCIEHHPFPRKGNLYDPYRIRHICRRHRHRWG